MFKPHFNKKKTGTHPDHRRKRSAGRHSGGADATVTPSTLGLPEDFHAGIHLIY